MVHSSDAKLSRLLQCAGLAQGTDGSETMSL